MVGPGKSWIVAGQSVRRPWLPAITRTIKKKRSGFSRFGLGIAMCTAPCAVMFALVISARRMPA